MSEKSTKFERGSVVTITGMPGKYEVADGPNKKGELYLTRGVLGVWVSPDKIHAASADFSELRNPSSIRKRAKNKGQSAGQKRERIDLHALTVSQALANLETRLSQALIDGTNVLEVVHGFGSGRIKTAVQQYLSQSKHVARYELDSGNQGVTLAYLV